MHSITQLTHDVLQQLDQQYTATQMHVLSDVSTINNSSDRGQHLSAILLLNGAYERLSILSIYNTAATSGDLRSRSSTTQ
jgi:hypothetical protein